jgi:hypothetical protein
VNRELINKSWASIQKLDIKIHDNKFGSLIHLENCISFFNLSPLPEISFNPQFNKDVSSIEPSFKNLSNEILLILRLSIYNETNMEVIAAWAEKIMRFCELRYGSLKNRSVKKCGNINAAQLHMLLLTSFLLDYADDSKDMRFLNIVLKLMDLKWIYNKINLINAKIADVNEFLQCRLLIKTELILLNL